MLVDAAPASCEQFANALGAAAFDVAIAPSASAAKELLAAGLRADVVVLNLQTTGGEGRELWEHRWTHLATPPVPVVAITSVATHRGGAESIEAAAFEPSLLVTIVKTVLVERARRRPR